MEDSPITVHSVHAAVHVMGDRRLSTVLAQTLGLHMGVEAVRDPHLTLLPVTHMVVQVGG